MIVLLHKSIHCYDELVSVTFNLKFSWLFTAQEPCTNYIRLPDPKYRGAMCPSVVGRDLCDKYTDAQWFRVEGDVQIVTGQVNILHCATAFPIWMNGLYKFIEY